jgi:F-box and leucine-rich repeat protein GRR1
MLSPEEEEKPLPHRPTTWLEVLPPLFLRHRAENLRVLDLTSCNVTDEAISGIVFHAQRIQTLILTACTQLTDGALESIARLGDNLDILVLAHVSLITDRGLVKLARECVNLRCIDVACELVFTLLWNQIALTSILFFPSLSKPDRHVGL